MTPGPEAQELPLRKEPEGGVPALVDTPEALAGAIEALGSGSGPIAVDAERASGFRYSQRAYLVQLFRRGAGVWLLDPVALPDLSALGAAIAAEEWVLHAASQDLTCLAEVGLAPTRLFDTELAARLLGYPRVGLGTMVGELLGIGLAKEHSAADWSTRPLPADWLAYAALDVELLVDIRDELADELDTEGKRAWAEEEFEATRLAGPPRPKAEPWRRTSGIHAVHDARQLGILRELWNTRDQIAAARDTAPGRALPDAAMVMAATTPISSAKQLAAIRPFSSPVRRRDAEAYFAAIQRGRGLSPSELPSARPPRGDGPPPVKAWASRAPEAAARLRRARAVIAELAESLRMPPENLAPAPAVRALAWEPDSIDDPAAVAEQLRRLGAREWQISLTLDPLTAALAGPARR